MRENPRFKQLFPFNIHYDSVFPPKIASKRQEKSDMHRVIFNVIQVPSLYVL